MRFDDYNIPTLKSWEKFQKMVCELFREIWQDPYAQEYGRRGQTQDGIDIIGKKKGQSKYEAVQATIEEPLTKQKVRKDYKASQKLDIELNNFIIASSSKRDVGLQKYAIKISNEGPYPCKIWFWEDLVEKLADYDHIRKKYYPNFAIKSFGASSGKLIEINDDTTRWVLFIAKLPKEHPHYGNVLLISDLLNYRCQTYRLGDHWSRLVLGDIEESSYGKCVGGNLYGAFLLSSWLNSFSSNEELFAISDNSNHYYELSVDQKQELNDIINKK